MKKLMISALSFTLSFSAFTCVEDGSEGFVPEHDLKIPVNTKMNSNIDETAFNDIIDKVAVIYAPIISEMGASLDVQRNWEDDTVNAYARQAGTSWQISMFGGLARHETVTPDGFALVVCHEIGHHIGGAPKKSSWWGTSWASNEGQADYFATLKCLRKTFENENNEEIVGAMDVPDVVVNRCSELFTDNNERLICQRGAMAGMSVARLFQALRNSETTPSFTTPDPMVVTRTNHNHPAFQCRLDTYYQGALCTKLVNDEVSQTDEEAGVCYRANGDDAGNRPLCWFKPARE